jgi:RimJ/RimL family protein N-acetyltransferase
MTFREAPELVTARLVLRGHRLGDFADCASMWADPDVTRYISGRPVPREEAWMKLLRNVGHWSLRGFGFWVVRERGSGAFVGEVGLGEFKRDMVLTTEGVPEIGWVVAPAAHKKGFATEAARAALAWFDAQIGMPRTSCLIHPDNAPSLRVAAKCGYDETLRTTYKGQPVVLLHRELATRA